MFINPDFWIASLLEIPLMILAKIIGQIIGYETDGNWFIMAISVIGITALVYLLGIVFYHIYKKK